MIILKTPTQPGIIIAHIVFSIPKALTTKKVGISPPWINIVNTKNMLKNVRPRKSFRERGYAAVN